jgi:hypothetical protein
MGREGRAKASYSDLTFVSHDQVVDAGGHRGSVGGHRHGGQDDGVRG